METACVCVSHSKKQGQALLPLRTKNPSQATGAWRRAQPFSPMESPLISILRARLRPQRQPLPSRPLQGSSWYRPTRWESLSGLPARSKAPPAPAAHPVPREDEPRFPQAAPFCSASPPRISAFSEGSSPKSPFRIGASPLPTKEFVGRGSHHNIIPQRDSRCQEKLRLLPAWDLPPQLGFRCADNRADRFRRGSVFR